MKKKQRNIIIISITSLVLFLLFANQMGYLTIILGANKMNCKDEGSNMWSCSMVGGGAEGLGEKIDLEINEPTNANTYLNLLCSKMLFLTGVDCLRGMEEGALWRAQSYPLVISALKDQLIIIQGTARDVVGVGEDLGTFETYGLCDVPSRKCWVYNPYTDTKRTVELSVTSAIIYFKAGGYVETDACLEFNICPKINVYRFGNNQCNLLTISENERTFNDYDTLSECESKIIVPPNKINIYRFEENQCTLMNILESEKTELDFDTLEECEERIIVPPTTDITIIVTIILIIIGVLIVLYFYLRKK